MKVTVIPTFLHVLICANILLAESVETNKPNFIAIKPILPPATEWNFNEYWHQRTIGSKDFYMADQGPYLRITKEGVGMLKQVGLYDRMIPGHINYSIIKYLLPENRRALKNAAMKKMFEQIFENKWPIHTLFYCRLNGNPPPSERLMRIIDEQWIGDGQPETVYRLEPIFHFLKTGQRWEGSSMYLWDKAVARDFFANDLIPELERTLPFIHNLNHKWTHQQLRILSDKYCEIFYRPVKRPVAWGMYVGNYHLASLPEVVAIGEKGADAFSNARARGTMRQLGGSKFYTILRGHEPTEKYAYFKRAWNSIRGDEWGMPLPHIRYYIFRPYLIGANYYFNEGMPSSCIRDIEADKQYELSTLGHIVVDMLDFVDRWPERGISIAPVALMLDYNRSFSLRGAAYFGSNLLNDDTDHMNQGIFEAIFPEHRHAYGTGGYSRTAPLGEIFDILQPNMPSTGADVKALENYNILFALRGMTFDKDFSTKIKSLVKRGKTLVLSASDATEHIEEDFLGFELDKKRGLIGGTNVICVLTGKRTNDSNYFLNPVKLTTAEPIFEDIKGNPVVVKNHYGKGFVISLLPDFTINRQPRMYTSPRKLRYIKKDILDFMPDFIEHLTAGTTPIEVRRTSSDKPDLSWLISKKGESWIVTLFNYSCARESIVSVTEGTGKVRTEYPLKEIPFEIICRTKVADVVELYNGRDVKWTKVNDAAVISETIHGGEIRVYELGPNKIELGTKQRFVNYALNQPVISSSFQKGYEAKKAIDGRSDTYWWSDTDPKHHRAFETPQWIQVYLRDVKTIDHIFVKFFFWPGQSLETRLHIYKYIVEASLDGKEWIKVIDESKNEDVADKYVLQRWFDPVKARYVRLTVLHNSALSGARLVEMKVMGKETEKYSVKRNPVDYRR